MVVHRQVNAGEHYLMETFALEPERSLDSLIRRKRYRRTAGNGGAAVAAVVIAAILDLEIRTRMILER